MEHWNLTSGRINKYWPTGHGRVQFATSLWPWGLSTEYIVALNPNSDLHGLIISHDSPEIS